ncbi:MAG TPA: hypothetical protein VNM45_21155 [Bacillus sp. (in: firmicutes)]|nr:hypothetical protein [Bacillus sp. (in: firmicutes)]
MVLLVDHGENFVMGFNDFAETMGEASEAVVEGFNSITEHLKEKVGEALAENVLIKLLAFSP